MKINDLLNKILNSKNGKRILAQVKQRQREKWEAHNEKNWSC